jgi:hypothetical protein
MPPGKVNNKAISRRTMGEETTMDGVSKDISIRDPTAINQISITGARPATEEARTIGAEAISEEDTTKAKAGTTLRGIQVDMVVIKNNLYTFCVHFPLSSFSFLLLLI